MTDDRHISPALLLDLYDEPIAFHRAHLRLTGSVTAALLLSTACHLAADLPEDAHGWLRMSTADWQRETGLSRFEQETARRLLRNRGLIEDRRRGMPARLELRVRTESLLGALRVQAETSLAAAAS